MAKEEELEMMITLHLSDGRKITKDTSKLIPYDPIQDPFRRKVAEGSITVNVHHIVDMRPAEPDEIEHAKIHGW